MRKIRLADHLTDEEPAERMELSENKQQFRRWQAIYLIQTQGLSSAQIAETVRVKSGTVLQRVYLYNSPYAVIFKGCNFCSSAKAVCNALI